MTTASDKTTQSQSGYLDPLTAPGLPKLPDSLKSAELVGALKLAAAGFPQCKSAYRTLAAMTAAACECPKVRAVPHIARFGMAEARPYPGPAAAGLKGLARSPSHGPLGRIGSNATTPQPGQRHASFPLLQGPGFQFSLDDRDDNRHSAAYGQGLRPPVPAPFLASLVQVRAAFGGSGSRARPLAEPHRFIAPYRG